MTGKRADNPTHLLPHLRTQSLERAGEHTVALIVFQNGDAPYSGPVRFGAAFPVRAEKGAQPVTVRDENGVVVPSRLAESRVETHPDLPPGRRLWTLTLEFMVSDVPARGWRGYGAVFGASPESRSDDASFWAGQWQAVSSALPTVWETDCHPGDLPLTGSYDIIS